MKLMLIAQIAFTHAIKHIPGSTESALMKRMKYATKWRPNFSCK